MSFSKKLITVAMLSIIIGSFFMQAAVFAQTPACDSTKEPPTECWPKDLCKSNWAQTANSKTSCGKYEKTYGKPLGYCYAKQPDVNLKIAFGEKSVVKGLADYIGSVYNYLIAIVSIVAIVMIMVGGLRYLTAGGNPSAITSAKETILGAVIGLFLTLGSYTLLQTVNPALVSLKLPDIKMVRTSTLCAKGSECPADSPQNTGKITYSNCKNNCECPKKWECMPVEGSAGQIITASKLTVWGATAVAGGAVVGGANVAAGAKYILKGSVEALKKVASVLGKFVLYNPLETAQGVGGYLLLSSLGGSSSPTAQSVDNGICIQWAKQSIPGGGLCASTENCISGLKCLNINTPHEELTGKKIGDIGSCVGDKKVFEGTLACTKDETCVANAGSNTDLRCVGGFCSWGEENHTCCANGWIDNTQQLCGKGFNECKKDPNNPNDPSKNFSCGFYYAGAIYTTDGQYKTASADPGLLTTLKETIKNSAGKCTKDDDASWAPESAY